MTIPELLNTTSGIFTSVTVILAGFVATVKYANHVVRSIRAIIKQLDDLKTEVDSVKTSVAKVEAESSFNGGASQKDLVLGIKNELTTAILTLGKIEASLLVAMQLTGKAFWRSGASGECTYASVRLSQMMGATPDQILGFGWVSYVDSQYREPVSLEWISSVKDKREFHKKYAYIHEDGSTISVIGHAIPILDKHGSLVELIGWADPVDPHLLS